jgi:hypothetical protein
MPFIATIRFYSPLRHVPVLIRSFRSPCPWQANVSTSVLTSFPACFTSLVKPWTKQKACLPRAANMNLMLSARECRVATTLCIVSTMFVSCAIIRRIRLQTGTKPSMLQQRFAKTLGMCKAEIVAGVLSAVPAWNRGEFGPHCKSQCLWNSDIRKNRTYSCTSAHSFVHVSLCKNITLVHTSTY